MESSGGACGLSLARGAQYLSQDESNHVSGLPVAGMEEVGQGHSGEGGEDIGAIQGVVDPLHAPPLGCDCGAKRLMRTEQPRSSMGLPLHRPSATRPALNELRTQRGWSSFYLLTTPTPLPAPPL
jgi:hypothetical protein